MLEPLGVRHAEAMFEVLSDPEIYRHLDYSTPPSLDHLRELYRRLEAGRSPDGSELWLNWAVRAADHALLGYVQATVVTHDRAWVAYVLSSEHWGRGHAYAAVSAMLQHLGAEHGVAEFMAVVEAANARSIRLLERLQFRLAGTEQARMHALDASERLFLRGRASCR